MPNAIALPNFPLSRYAGREDETLANIALTIDCIELNRIESSFPCLIQITLNNELSLLIRRQKREQFFLGGGEINLRLTSRRSNRRDFCDQLIGRCLGVGQRCLQFSQSQCDGVTATTHSGGPAARTTSRPAKTAAESASSPAAAKTAAAASETAAGWADSIGSARTKVRRPAAIRPESTAAARSKTAAPARPAESAASASRPAFRPAAHAAAGYIRWPAETIVSAAARPPSAAPAARAAAGIIKLSGRRISARWLGRSGSKINLRLDGLPRLNQPLHFRPDDFPFLISRAKLALQAI